MIEMNVALIAKVRGLVADTEAMKRRPAHRTQRDTASLMSAGDG